MKHLNCGGTIVNERCNQCGKAVSTAIAPEFVFLVWCNDWLMDVYKNEDDANTRLKRFIATNSGHEWYPVPGSYRFAMKNGPVARLEVEKREVKESV